MCIAAITIDGASHQCEARPYAWVLGLGVEVSVFRNHERVALVRILCPGDSEEYEALAALSESDRAQLALDRFVNGDLNVTPTSLVQAQQRMHSISGKGVVAIIAAFKVRPD